VSNGDTDQRGIHLPWIYGGRKTYGDRASGRLSQVLWRQGDAGSQVRDVDSLVEM